MNNQENILIASLTPYFLEKGHFWFEQNLNKILEARKSQSFFQDNTLYLSKNEKINLSQILKILDEMGYEKVFQVQEPGEFSVRGGILDVFPINSDSAFRAEFLGNKIESIQLLESIKTENKEKAKEILRKKLKSQKLFSDLKGLKPGDYLVHLDHGVAQFSGIKKLKIENYYSLEYSQGDKLYVPLGLERKLSRYIGFVEPKINRLGSLIWQQTKRKVKKEAEKLAKELLEVYAKRTVSFRPPYLKEDEIDFQLADTFEYEESADQIQALQEIKEDLEKTEPMDRIVCGDVGFGKTEVALRTIIKAVKSGYQAAMICPTTILADQHFQNFKERLKDLPINLAILSRLQTKKEQRKIIEELKAGKTDLIIGTHRLLSKDLENWLVINSHDRANYESSQASQASRNQKGLGLLVIDDEQRFGVKQKEKFKKLKASLDVLSLSATPIPRTLYMALSSLKNISLIQTPPLGRLAVKTFILPFSEKTIKKAIKEEICRGGQIYYLHNRIETIETAKRLIQKLIPNIKISLAHGRLKEKELVKAMESFRNKKVDLLIATTIIENGLDLPNVNTLIAADAAKLGLAQAYQIRGRIGRSHIQAFAYFLYSSRLPGKAKMRLDALKQAEELGSGYKIALKDLEIRGAGNILGREQSGNINRVGLNLYCQMLSQAIEKIKTNR